LTKIMPEAVIGWNGFRHGDTGWDDVRLTLTPTRRANSPEKPSLGSWDDTKSGSAWREGKGRYSDKEAVADGEVQIGLSEGLHRR
jgi:hypothetical protein